MATTATDPQPTWTAPGPGSWDSERSHGSPGRTPVYQRISSEHTAPVYRQVFADYGGAIDTIDFKWVNGAMFMRLVPLVGADRDTGKVPPRPVLWLASRLHPTFRRREKQARRVLATRSFLDAVKAWNGGEREQWRDANLALQAVPVADLDDGGLADHLDALDRHLVAGWRRHHQLHGSDLGPIGDLMAHSKEWGLDPVAVMGLLKGASPATTEAASHGRAIAGALAQGGADPAGVTTLDQVRSVPAAAAALDRYLEEYGWRLVSDYDIDGLTLNEVPGAVCALVRRAAGVTGGEPSHDRDREPAGPAEAELAGPGPAGAAPTVTGSIGTVSPEQETLTQELRARCPDPALFDELLDSARQAYGVRDDNGPLTWEWPAGLTRRAYLEAGRRLAAAGRVHQPGHVFELDLSELSALLRSPEAGPAADAVAQRADVRAWQATLDPPETLGPVAPEPDLSALPPGIRRTMGLILAAVTMLDPDPARRSVPLQGLGIGSRTYVGRARVADDPNRAIQEMEPGDVLVAPWTAPSYNAVLAIAGGIVVQEGGLLCHAAVMARELDLPAVIGCVDAMSSIASGDLVEIDPAAGTVTILER